ncbi:hypothetical protein [Tsukamurella sp. PLM1]|uniref:hypothetical protein n=1 Tax=Tsukamurella sp. PLM1 TaxID=2929795 RepID=UPI00205C7384|nr:hypothetical protein [Tsukamurella sp. PLM1]BDH58757.1 hypothetical protein MTP03_36960 [Tsukamurella sp. PLM1]
MNESSAPAVTPPDTAGERGIAALAASRWPAGLAVAMSVDTFSSEVTDELVRNLAAAMALLPTMYVIMVALDRRRLTWPVLVVLLVCFVGLEMQDLVPPVVVVLGVALAFAAVGHVRGRFADGVARLQLVGLAAFGALSVLGLLAEPQLARYVVAAGWFGHGIWDLVHLIRDRVVARSWAQWCAVLDILIAVALVVVPLYLPS